MLKYNSLDKKKIEKKVVSRVATGNIFLQKGIYQTKEDIDKKRANLKNYSFIK